jgi:nucleotide-binding universal stress UspA family protein
MYERILVPVDGSEFAEQMIPYAAALSRKTGAKLALLRIVSDASEQDQGRRQVGERAASIDAEALCVVAKGDVAPAIRAEANKTPGTLVAMSSHGRSGAAEAIFGSVALDLIRSAKQPVVVYRPQGASAGLPIGKIGRVVLPLDGSPESESMIGDAVAFAKWIGARIIVVSVLDPTMRLDPGIPPSDVQESSYVHGRARDIAQKYGMEAGWEVLHGDPKLAIPSFVQSLGDAMLAMTTHGRSALKTVVAGSVTAACLRDSGVPVLTRIP